jgi:serine/threonine-protein kinase
MSDLRNQLERALRGTYTIGRVLGAGGMATVYLARDVKHNRDVALKVLRPDVAHTIGADRFLHEIQFAARLSHPHILPLLDSGEANGLLFFAMPNAEGLSVRDQLNAGGKFPVDEAVRIAREVAGALDYAHRHGVVHRDIKPENIMLHEGHALVADFGIGKAMGAVEAAAFTQMGATVGTAAYMSPEQAAGDSIDGRSDIYSLGCVLYEMLSGAQLFTGPTLQAVIAKRFIQRPVDLTALREGVSRRVARAVRKALARNPVDRFETGRLFAVALDDEDDPPAREQSSAAAEKSIAVLPFVNVGADPENEFFADGFTEEIVNALSQIGDLRVAGKTSSFAFKGTNHDLRAIADQLNVRTVLEGTMRRTGKRVRITAQLIDVTDGHALWSEHYDREIEDVFAVQAEITSVVAEKMKTTPLLGDTRSQRATRNIAAYEAYLKGRALLYRRGNAVKQGLAHIEKALALDAEYGLAWAGLADAYSLLGYYGQLTPEVARAAAAEAATKALQFAPELAESQTARALVYLLFDWDWEGAERAFKRALELNPGYIQGGAWYHLFYQGHASGNWDQALAGLHELQQRDPLSGYLAAVISLAYGVSSDDPAALDWADKAMALDPEAFLSMWARQVAFHARSDWPRVVDAASVCLAVSGRQIVPLVSLGLALAESDDAIGARSVYDEVRSRAVREYVPPTCLAMLAAALGETDVAATYVREAARRHDPQLVVVAISGPGSGYLRAQPEYQRLLTEIRLPGWLAGRVAPRAVAREPLAGGGADVSPVGPREPECRAHRDRSPAS